MAFTKPTRRDHPARPVVIDCGISKLYNNNNFLSSSSSLLRLLRWLELQDKTSDFFDRLKVDSPYGTGKRFGAHRGNVCLLGSTALLFGEHKHHSPKAREALFCRFGTTTSSNRTGNCLRHAQQCARPVTSPKSWPPNPLPEAPSGVSSFLAYI